ncbi:hypothetical protein OOU_Y34scaffold00463g1 [Pyricularia oryzae Y34]|uniref:Uncharacterized protein n=2 Tax=Pyricularia oryzae TaxID=318829 RepID=A0AA97P0Z9_PYRO3|nr:hypothetical protein OOU_Y34scaffold00463g1 [Pyricularia oryzae Y34]
MAEFACFLVGLLDAFRHHLGCLVLDLLHHLLLRSVTHLVKALSALFNYSSPWLRWAWPFRVMFGNVDCRV